MFNEAMIRALIKATYPKGLCIKVGIAPKNNIGELRNIEYNYNYDEIEDSEDIVFTLLDNATDKIIFQDFLTSLEKKLNG
jgi:hypothetical protein